MSRAWLPLTLGLLSLLSLLFIASCTDEPANDSADSLGDSGSDDATESNDSNEGTETGETGDTGEDHTVPEFGGTFTIIGNAGDGLSAPRDLAFAPGAPDQLWTFNTSLHGAVIYFDPGTPEQTSEVRVDAYGQHFMAYVSSAAFGDNGNFASCQESRDEWNVGPQPPDDFMGATLWPADLDIFAVVNQEFPPIDKEGSHLDMLHQSPWCMGIAHDVDNVYWAMDGLAGNIVRYDFQTDHGPGNSDHSDGIITRYVDATLTRVVNIPGHMELDHESGLLYVVDTGGGRVMRLDTATGTNTGALPGEWDGAEYTGVEGADYTVLAAGLANPSGLALVEDRVLVSENGSGDVIAFDLEGTEIDRMSTPATSIMGITVGPDGRLWYVDPIANQVVRVDP